MQFDLGLKALALRTASNCGWLQALIRGFITLFGRCPSSLPYIGGIDILSVQDQTSVERWLMVPSGLNDR